MRHSIQYEPSPEGGPDVTHYASFVLRCWLSEEGPLHARLIDVHSGCSYPLADLAALPERIRGLLAQAWPEWQDDDP